MTHAQKSDPSLPSTFERLLARFFSRSSHLFPHFASQCAILLFSRPKRIQPTAPEQDLVREGTPVALQSGRYAQKWGQGEKVLLVHGWEGRGSQFHVLIRKLVEAGFEVTGWDAPAHGRSPGRLTHFVQFIETLKEDLPEMGPFDAVIGHSLGGAVVMQTSHLGVSFSKTVSIAAPGIIKDILLRFLKRIHFRSSQQIHFFRALEKKAGRTLQSLEPMQVLKNFSEPLLLIHDQDDRAIPYSEFEMLKSHFPQFKYLTTQGLGHRRILKDQAVIQNIIEFLRGTLGERRLNSSK